MSGDLAQMIVQHLRVSGALAEFADRLTEARRDDDARAEWVTADTTPRQADLSGGWEPFGTVPDAEHGYRIIWRRRVN